MPVLELKDSYLVRSIGNAAELAVPSSLIGLVWQCRVEILIATLYSISQAQLDSARHPDLLSELIMSGRPPRKESMTTVCRYSMRWSLFRRHRWSGFMPRPHRRSQELGLLAASTLGLLFSLRWKSGDLCLDEFKISRVWRLRYPNSR
jgi:hypothetical protein